MMFKPMRRIRQQLSKEECQKILQNQTVGTLALAAEGEYPYAVPLNYVYYNERIYFHCAVSGHKLDIIAKQNKVSFCIIDKDTIAEPKWDEEYWEKEEMKGREFTPSNKG